MSSRHLLILGKILPFSLQFRRASRDFLKSANLHFLHIFGLKMAKIAHSDYVQITILPFPQNHRFCVLGKIFDFAQNRTTGDGVPDRRVPGKGRDGPVAFSPIRRLVVILLL